MREVLGMRDIRVIAIALASGMWVFQLYSAFLPEFFQTVRGLTLEQAGSLTALIPFAGVFAAAGSGLMGGVIGLAPAVHLSDADTVRTRMPRLRDADQRRARFASR